MTKPRDTYTYTFDWEELCDWFDKLEYRQFIGLDWNRPGVEIDEIRITKTGLVSKPFQIKVFKKDRRWRGGVLR